MLNQPLPCHLIQKWPGRVMLRCRCAWHVYNWLSAGARRR